ncbi:MAG: ABC transporter permease [Alistipes sp.]|nr:ABC transporter permease [Alistipes sp.]
MKLKQYISLYAKEAASVMRNEYRAIFTDGGVMLILIFAIFIYSTLYGLAYGNQVLRNVPIGVIDNSKTSSSRALIDSFNAGPNAYVAYEAADMEEAKKLFYDRDIYGIVYIPSDYEKQLVGGLQAHVSLYCDASYFLMYRQVFQEIVGTLTQTGAMVEFQRLVAQGINIPQAQAVTQPVIYQSHNLFNPYLGYGTFVMPAIIMAIIQQTLLIGIGMIGGTWHEFDLYRKLTPVGEERMSTIPVVLGKTLTYMSICAVTTAYILTIHYHLYKYPMNGHPMTIIGLMLPYLLACIFLGITVSTLFTRRENSILWLLWSSIPLLLLSGVSYPGDAMPQWLFGIGNIFPSSHAINAFIRVQDMGAGFEDILPEITALWRLAVIYGGTALIAMHLTLNKELRLRIKNKVVKTVAIRKQTKRATR